MAENKENVSEEEVETKTEEPEVEYLKCPIQE